MAILRRVNFSSRSLVFCGALGLIVSCTPAIKVRDSNRSRYEPMLFSFEFAGEDGVLLPVGPKVNSPGEEDSKIRGPRFYTNSTKITLRLNALKATHVILATSSDKCHGGAQGDPVKVQAGEKALADKWIVFDSEMPIDLVDFGGGKSPTTSETKVFLRMHNAKGPRDLPPGSTLKKNLMNDSPCYELVFVYDDHPPSMTTHLHEGLTKVAFDDGGPQLLNFVGECSEVGRNVELALTGPKPTDSATLQALCGPSAHYELLLDFSNFSSANLNVELSHEDLVGNRVKISRRIAKQIRPLSR